ncbi:MAG: hypothetical protein H6735_14015 [Alphaproteobacteria bacterium]|nr:hypothetical protein [Alphaproteobacteria bacterium]
MWPLLLVGCPSKTTITTTDVVIDLTCIMSVTPDPSRTCDQYYTPTPASDLLLDDCGEEPTDLCVVAQSLEDFCTLEFAGPPGCPARSAWSELGFGHPRTCPGNDGREYTVLSADRTSLRYHHGDRADAVFDAATGDVVFVRTYEGWRPLLPGDYDCCDLDGVGAQPESYVWGDFVHLDCAWPQRHVFTDPS